MTIAVPPSPRLLGRVLPFAVFLAACGSSDAGSLRPGGDTSIDAPHDDVGPADDGSGDIGAPDSAQDASNADGNNPDGELPDPGDAEVDLPTPIAAVVTSVSASTLSAGASLFVTCLAVDAEGVTFALPEDVPAALIVAPSTTTEVVLEELRVIPRSTGQLSVACSVPSLGLIDPLPQDVRITPGPIHTLVTTLDPPSFAAGEFTEVQCDAFDAWGNRIPEPTVTRATDPFGEGIEVDREFVTATRAGLYDVRCDADGAADVVPAELEVRPGPAVSIAAAVQPDAAAYRVGEVVELRASVTDAWGNPIPDAPLTYSAVPDVPRFGEGRYRFDTEGTFDLFVNSGLLTASVRVIVNSEGPLIECTRPGDGTFVTHPEGTPIVFRGRATDAFGTESVTVNGLPATLTEDGFFEVTLPTRFGINPVEIIAADTDGNENSRVCAFLASEVYHPEGAFLTHAVSLALRQGALDDGGRSGAVNSLADVLHLVLNSRGLRDTLHSTLQGSNPLYDQCAQRVCIIGCFCALNVSVNHLDTQLNGPNAVTLSLVDGGLRAVATVRDTRFRVRIGGTFSSTGWVTFDEITVDLTFNTSLQSGRPRVSVRSINNVQVGRIRTDFSGLTGLVIDVVASLFNGTIRNLVRDVVRDFIRDNFNDTLDSLLSGLSIDALGTSFDVPRLDGSGSIRVGFGLQFSHLSANPSRMLFGIGTRFPGDITREGETPGAPIPRGAVLREPTSGRTVSAGVSLGLMNQVLHTLWRGGLFDANLSGALLGGFANDAVAVLRTNLPPVVAGSSGNAFRAMLGGVRATVLIPGVIDAPIQVAFGAVASSGVDLLPGDVLRFRDIRVDELWFSPLEGSLAPSQRQVLETFLREIVQYVVDESLNNALPALPIPGFAIPETLVPFGLPRGAELGLTGPALFNDATHFVVEGNFGVR